MEFRSLAGAAGCAAAFGVAVLVAPGAQADPQFNAAEKQYLGELYLYVHPSVTPPRLVGWAISPARPAAMAPRQTKPGRWSGGT